MHTYTVLIGFAVTDALIAAMVLFLWRQGREQFPGMGAWLAAFTVQAAAIVLVALRGVVPSAVAVVGGNTGVLGGVALFHLGLVRFTGTPARHRHDLALLAAFAAIDAYFALVAPSLGARTINLSAFMAVLSAQCAWLALRAAPADLRPMLRAIGAVFVVAGALSLVRICVTLLRPPATPYLEQSTASDAPTLLGYQVVTLGLAFALFLLVNRRLLAAAREDSRRYEQMFLEHSAAMLLIEPESGAIVEANAAAADFYGYSRAALRGMRMDAISELPEEEARRRRLEVKAGRADFFIVPHRLASGAVRTVELRAVPITHRGVTYNYAIIHDITARCRAEEERARIEHQLRHAQKMESIGRLAGGVAHDFNNLLGVILGSVNLAGSALAAGHPARDDLEEISRTARRAADLARQLLIFASKQAAQPRVLDLNATIDGVLTMLRRLIGEDIALVWSPGADVAAVRVNPSHLDQILANLCVNARDAIAGPGQLTISTEITDVAADGARPDVAPGRYVVLVVADSGCGMSAAVAERCFEPFYTTKDVGRGTGLGLSTVYGIVKQSGGFIELRTAPGAGATFRVHIPAHSGAAAAREAAAPAGADPGAETILLVEDDAPMLRTARRILAGRGYNVLAAASPAEALRAARDHAGAIEIVVTDVVLPEMSGTALWDELVALRPEVRCLFMSGYSNDVVAASGALGPRTAFIAKPFTADAFLARVREVLERPPASA